MSSQFTYEIDERKLRMQLKDLEYPLEQNAWNKFEAYATTKVIRKPTSTLGALRLNLNRKVVLPVVFGVVVVSFSIMLFNFISLKPRDKHLEQKADATLNVVKTIPAEPAKIVEKKNEETTSNANQTAQNSIQPSNTNPSAGTTPASPNSAPLTNPVEFSQTPTIQTAENVQQTTTTLVNTDLKSDTEVVTKRRHRKQDPAAQLQEEIRPTVVADSQQEEDVRPN